MTIMDYLFHSMLYVLYLWEYTFNPYDVANEYETEQDAYDDHIRHLMSAYGDIIKTVPLEVLYMIGYKNATNCIYLVEQIFDKDLLYNFDNEKEAYTGKFHPKMEKLLIKYKMLTHVFQIFFSSWSPFKTQIAPSNTFSIADITFASS